MKRKKIKRKLFSDKNYMTRTEAIKMKKLIEEGKLTFFRLKTCEADKCEKDIILKKAYCCFECKTKTESKKEN